MRSAIKIIISLDERNTGFRFFALKKGKVLGIVGSISYYGDTGGIVIHAEGKDTSLQQYVNTLRQGTPYSKVIVCSILFTSKFYQHLFLYWDRRLKSPAVLDLKSVCSDYKELHVISNF